jgi:hypothetical protein
MPAPPTPRPAGATRDRGAAATPALTPAGRGGYDAASPGSDGEAALFARFGRVSALPTTSAGTPAGAGAASALELAAKVERWLADEPVAAWREPWAARPRAPWGAGRQLL